MARTLVRKSQQITPEMILAVMQQLQGGSQPAVQKFDKVANGKPFLSVRDTLPNGTVLEWRVYRKGYAKLVINPDSPQKFRGGENGFFGYATEFRAILDFIRSSSMNERFSWLSANGLTDGK